MIDTTKAPASGHYKKLVIEPIELITALKLDFVTGSFVKYLARYPYKGNPKTDLEKARFYLFEIEIGKHSLFDNRMAWHLVNFFAAANQMGDIETACLRNTLNGFREDAAECLNELITRYDEPT